MKTQISDSITIERLCRMQRRFVSDWNAAELNHGIGQSDDLPAGASYSGSKPRRGASFVLPDGTWVAITAHAPWWHWHEGWSFCRNPLSPEQVQKVVVHGSMESFERWFIDACDCDDRRTMQELGR